MASGNEWEEEKKMAFENGEDAEKMLQFYIYNYMKKKNLHDVAEIFAQEANLEISQLSRCDECDETLLMDWWEIFWPKFCSSLLNLAGANAQSSGKPSMVNAQAMLALLKNQGANSSRQTPMTNPQQDVLPVIPTTGMGQQIARKTPLIPNFNNEMQEIHASSFLPLLEMNQQIIHGLNNCGNVIAQSPSELLSAPGINQHRTGKLEMNTVSDSILGQSAAEPLLVAEAFKNRPLGFSLVEFPQSQALLDANNMLYRMPPSGSRSYLQLPATMETPAQVTKDPKNDGLGRSDEMELTGPVGPNSADTIIEDHAGLSAAQALGKGPLGFPPVQLLPTQSHQWHLRQS